MNKRENLRVKSETGPRLQKWTIRWTQRVREKNIQWDTKGNSKYERGGFSEIRFWYSKDFIGFVGIKWKLKKY